MRKKSGRAVRMTGGALALALGAGVVLGTVPAQANSWHTYWIATSYHGNNRPSDEAAQRETRSEANRRCQAAYGFFKARGVTAWGLGRYDNTWEQNWRCDSN